MLQLVKTFNFHNIIDINMSKESDMWTTIT